MKKKIFFPIILLTVLLTGCTKFLDRKPLDSYDDSNFWLNEGNIRQHANFYYSSTFFGYGDAWSEASQRFRDLYANDQATYSDGQPGSFPVDATDVGFSYRNQSVGIGWSFEKWETNYSWIRNANVFIKRLDEASKGVISDEAYNHWSGVARLFRAVRYAELVWGFGDVPYYWTPVESSNMDELCKPRTNRYEVIDSIRKDFDYAIKNMRESDGDNLALNKYAAAHLASRYFMWFGEYQHYITADYQGGDQAKAKEYLDYAIKCAEVVMNSGKYSIATPYRELFSKASLDGDPEVILNKHYSATQKTHCLTSYQNYNEGQSISISAHMVNSYLCWDGKLANETTVIPDAQNPDNYGKLFSMVDNQLLATHDPRLEATIKSSRKLTNGAMSAPYSTVGAATRYYIRKMFPRGGEHYTGSQAASDQMTRSASNFTNSPVLRYGETLLNWITCKVELATWGGGPAVTQAEIDKSINVIRNRPLSGGYKTPELTVDPRENSPADIGVTHKLAPMSLADLPTDLTRDPDVTPLQQEIRRERMVELAFEQYRTRDLRAWGKWLQIAQRYDRMPGKYCNETGGGSDQFNGGDKVVGWGKVDSPTGTINQAVQYYKDAPQGNLHQCGAYFELDVLYDLQESSRKAWEDAKAAGKPTEEIDLLANQRDQWKAAFGAFEGQGTGSTGGLWCVDQFGVQHHWLKTDGYAPETLKKMRGWYIVGKHSLLTVTGSELPRYWQAALPLNQITFYSDRNYTLQQNKDYKDRP